MVWRWEGVEVRKSLQKQLIYYVSVSLNIGFGQISEKTIHLDNLPLIKFIIIY